MPVPPSLRPARTRSMIRSISASSARLFCHLFSAKACWNQAMVPSGSMPSFSAIRA
jgi:hypothetical protein